MLKAMIMSYLKGKKIYSSENDIKIEITKPDGYKCYWELKPNSNWEKGADEIIFKLINDLKLVIK